MTPEGLFRICNTLALLGWLMLAVLGRKPWVPALVTGVIIPLAFGFTYLALRLLHWGETSGGFGSLAAVATLFSNPWLLLAGWIHYLAFDLFIGSWQTRDAMRHGMSHWLVVPCLALTFLFGPVGLLSYFALRFTLRRRLSSSETL